MPKLYVTEYATISALPNHSGQMPFEPPLTEQVLDFTSGVATSNPFRPGTRMVRLNCDATCSLIVGANPTATTTNGRLAADRTEYRGVPEGSGFKVSVVSNT
jgi:hypothetical protein